MQLEFFSFFCSSQPVNFFTGSSLREQEYDAMLKDKCLLRGSMITHGLRERGFSHEVMPGTPSPSGGWAVDLEIHTE